MSQVKVTYWYHYSVYHRVSSLAIILNCSKSQLDRMLLIAALLLHLQLILVKIQVLSEY